MYLEVVQELKERFGKTREIHRLLTKTLLDLPSPKQTRVDLRTLTDTVKRTINSLKATKYYYIEAFLTSLVYSILPSRLQTLWDQATKKDKGVPPISQLLIFIREHAETLPSLPTPPSQSDKPADRKSYRKPDRKEPHPPKVKGAVHIAAPTSTYRWECALCKPDRHPLHLCPKWASFNVTQRLGHIQAKSFMLKLFGRGPFY